MPRVGDGDLRFVRDRGMRAGRRPRGVEGFAFSRAGALFLPCRPQTNKEKRRPGCLPIASES